MADNVYADRVKEKTQTTGTGSVTLLGGLTGFQSFSVVGNGGICDYCIFAVDANGAPTGDWEVGRGTYSTTGPSLSRDHVYSSTNGNALVNFGSGDKYVILDLPAAKVSMNWSSVYAYQIGDLVRGSDFNVYRCVFPNTGIDPTSDGGTNWQLIFVFASITLNVDSQFVGNLNNAWNYLLNATIAGKATVTIQLGDASYGAPTALLNHPQGAQITITGTNVYTPSVTSIQSSSGSAGAWLIVLNVSSTTNLTAAGYAIIRNPSGGTNPTYLAGCHVITNVDTVNSRITISSKHQASSAPSGTVTATCAVVMSRISGSSVGLTVDGNRALGLLDKVVLVGSGLGIGLAVGVDSASPSRPGGSVCLGKDVGVVNFSTGVQVGYGASLISGDGTDALAVSGCSVNLRVNGQMSADGLIVSGASGDGVSVLGGTLSSASSHAVVTGNGGRGLHVGSATLGGRVLLSSGKITGNASDGVEATESSSVNLTSASVLNNGGWGCVAFNCSGIRAASTTFSGNTSGTTSPTTGTVGNSNSLVYTT